MDQLQRYNAANGMIATDPVVIDSTPPHVEEPAKTCRYLKAVYDRFARDQTVLIPVREGEPLNKEWEGVSLEKTRDINYQFDLASSDIAVEFGPKSNNLAAIRFGEAKAREDFLAKNPLLLKDALLSSVPGGFYVWIRFEHDPAYRPMGFEHETCDLICEGIILVATRDSKAGYRFDNEGHPATIKLRDIVWPDAVVTLLAVRKAEGDFPMVVMGEHGEAKLSDDHIVALFRAHNPKVHFNPVTAWFYLPLADGQVRRIYEEQVKKGLYELLTFARLKTRKKFVEEMPSPALAEAIAQAGFAPAADRPKKLPVHVDMGLRHLTELVGLLKVLAVRPFEVPAQEDEEAKAFTGFIQTRFEREPGENLTVEEARCAYREFCFSEGHPQLPERQFRARLPEAVKSRLGIDKSHDILRDGMAKRGFRNLRLKRQDADSGIETLRTERTERTAFLPGVDWFDRDLSGELAVAA